MGDSGIGPLPIFTASVRGGGGGYGGNVEAHATGPYFSPSSLTLAISPSVSVGTDFATSGAKPYATVGAEATFFTPTLVLPLPMLPILGVEVGAIGDGGVKALVKPSLGAAFLIPSVPLFALSAAYTPQITQDGFKSGFQLGISGMF